MSEHVTEPTEQIDPKVVKEVENEESERYKKWQEQQSQMYLNNRVIELSMQNRELREKISQLEEISAVPGTVDVVL